mmetsp:Transcript_23058/g.66003  ORF Transcript_23058/g.66003 Transcript_23058/m.66003 type:complete len:204 (-) Transcript_23058:7-618(-)
MKSHIQVDAAPTTLVCQRLYRVMAAILLTATGKRGPLPPSCGSSVVLISRSTKPVPSPLLLRAMCTAHGSPASSPHSTTRRLDVPPMVWSAVRQPSLSILMAACVGGSYCSIISGVTASPRISCPPRKNFSRRNRGAGSSMRRSNVTPRPGPSMRRSNITSHLSSSSHQALQYTGRAPSNVSFRNITSLNLLYLARPSEIGGS